MFTLPVIKELLHSSVTQRRKLEETYALLPATNCRRRTLCCSLLPEMHLLEALGAIQHLVVMDHATRKRLIRKIVTYFFLNPVEIISCPFLDGRDCLIYRDRFFGCRAYGLWSKEYYEKLTATSRQAKTYVRKQWEKLNISLPQEVTDFQIPYCHYVEVDGKTSINDEMLMNVSNIIESLSQRLSQWHHLFSKMYFSDLSFLLSSLMFGITESVQLKFAIVKDIVSTGNREKLGDTLGKLPDFFRDLT